MGELTEVRWTRYGKDRLYLKDEAGSDVAWIDLVSGRIEFTQHDRAPDVLAIAARHGVTSSPTTTTPQTAPMRDAGPSLPEHPTPQTIATATGRDDQSPSVVASAELTDWHDLALNRPGQAARARAEEELAAMRDRSRVGTWIARTFDMKTDERAWRVGADGEETIGAKLDKLTRDGWYVLHAVPVGSGDSDIDHVVIGTGGVFTVNTKKHPGKKVWVSQKVVMVDGHRTQYLRNSRYEGERASRLLTAACGFPVLVKPILIFTTGTLVPDVTIKSRPEGIGILDRMDVPRAFKRAAPVLTQDQVEQVFAVARRSTTWTTT